MADSYTYAGSFRAKMVLTTYSGASTAVLSTIRLDGFSVVPDTPVEQIAPLNSSLGDAGSAGIVSYSGSFSARLLVKNFTTRRHSFLIGSSNASARTLATFYPSSKEKYEGPIFISNINIDAAGNEVVKFNGSWAGCDSFEYSTI